jgi:hypothetical protein
LQDKNLGIKVCPGVTFSELRGEPAQNIDIQSNMKSNPNTLNTGPWRRQAGEVSLPEVHGSIRVPKTASFWRKMLAFAGPGALVAVGYMDPGNWATDLQGGAKFGYTLLSAPGPIFEIPRKNPQSFTFVLPRHFCRKPTSLPWAAPLPESPKAQRIERKL